MRVWCSCDRHGVTLVEVLVALAVLAVCFVGWSGALQVAVTLLRRISELSSSWDSIDVVALCALASLVPYRPPLQCRHDRLRATRQRRCAGLTLVEIMVALGLSVLVLILLSATVAGSVRLTRTALVSAKAILVEEAVTTLLVGVVAAAGRGLTSVCGLASTAPATRIVLRHALYEGTIVEDEVFSALDSGGRPALYLRRAPHPRQPWFEDVTGFRVLGITFDAVGRAERVQVEVTHIALEVPIEIDIPLPHRPCVEAGAS